MFIAYVDFFWSRSVCVGELHADLGALSLQALSNLTLEMLLTPVFRRQIQAALSYVSWRTKAAATGSVLGLPLCSEKSLDKDVCLSSLP